MKTLEIDHPDKNHPLFDFESAKKLYDGMAIGGELVSSPFDIYSNETLRDRYGFREEKPSVKTDVMLFSRGTPPKKYLTQIGGMPYGAGTFDWPKRKGKPMPFFAQFSFLDSLGLFADLPGHLLLIFADESVVREEYSVECYCDEQDCFKFIWLVRDEKADREPTPEPSQEMPIAMKEPWYGVLHRTVDYPAISKTCNMRLDEDKKVSSFFLPILNATKIRGVPHFIQGNPGKLEDGSQVKKLLFLCQLSSIQAAPDVPFPWCNCAKKMILDFGENGIYGAKNQLSMFDMGNIYFFMKPNGRIVWHFDCY